MFGWSWKPTHTHTHTHTHESVTKILPSALSMVIRAVSCTFVVYAQNNYQNSDWIYFFILFYFIFIYFFCICNSAVFYCTVFYIHIYFTVSVLYKLLGLFVCSAVELSVLINLSWVEYYHSMCVRTVMLRTRVTKSGEAQQCVETQAWTGHCAIVPWHRRPPPPSMNTGAPWPLRIFLIIMVTISVDRQHYR